MKYKYNIMEQKTTILRSNKQKSLGGKRLGKVTYGKNGALKALPILGNPEDYANAQDRMPAEKWSK